MRFVRKAALCYVGGVFLLALAAGLVAPHDYATQFRDAVGEPPSLRFLLGTDDLGRDRFSRLLYATRLSLVLSPVTAAAATLLAAVLGLVSGWRGGWLDGGISIVADLFLSLPLLFLVLTLRALLPLNVSATISVAVLGVVLVAAGWPSGMRVTRAATRSLSTSPAILHARAFGCGAVRLMAVHVAPRLRPPVAAQFWILVPTFLIAEANLGILGLGVGEPLPSLGNSLAELRDYQRIFEAPWILAPAVVLVSVIAALHFLISGVDSCE
jgi:peptide/nickel transport system permease protein